AARCRSLADLPSRVSGAGRPADPPPFRRGGDPVRELASESTSPMSGVISVSAATDRRHRLVAALGLTGAALGIVAGAVQATIGPRIPEWTGAKASPVALGLLTIGLSALAGFVAVRQRDGGLSVWA